MASSLTSLRRCLYLTQRSIGDFQAAQRGPAVLGKRIIRRNVTRRIGRSYNRAWR